MKGFGEELWVYASGACDYSSNRKDRIPWEDARKRLDDFDDFDPNLLKDIPPFFEFEIRNVRRFGLVGC